MPDGVIYVLRAVFLLLNSPAGSVMGMVAVIVACAELFQIMHWSVTI